MKNNKEASTRQITDFLSLKGSIKTNKPFNLKAMEKAIGDNIIKKYLKKMTSSRFGKTVKTSS